MNFKTFNALIKLNKGFYDKVCEDFSKTREKPWEGWGRVVRRIQKKFAYRKKVSVLDLGCGNGRFYGYLVESLPKIKIEYLGLDSNEYLLGKAKERFNGAEFKKHDVILSPHGVDRHCDIVVAFGLTHHIPSENFRKKWFLQVADLVNDDGLFVFTVWNFGKDPRFKKAVQEIHTRTLDITAVDLENNDYFLGWGDERGIYRYFHEYSSEELGLIQQSLKGIGFKLLEKFESDGRGGNLNKYYLFSRKDQ